MFGTISMMLSFPNSQTRKTTKNSKYNLSYHFSAMIVANLTLSPIYFTDVYERQINTNFSIALITDVKEMDATLDRILTKIRSDFYEIIFALIFGLSVAFMLFAGL